jgi:hypothetical protein
MRLIDRGSFMKFIFNILFLGFFGLHAQATEATPPNTDRHYLGFFHCSGPQGLVSFTAELEDGLRAYGEALLISVFQPYYEVPTLNKVHYRANTKSGKIQVDHESFSLIIQANGEGVYQRKGEVESPPDMPTGGSDAKPVEDHWQKAPYDLYGPIDVHCSTPFTQGVPQPTGFSVGNR